VRCEQKEIASNSGTLTAWQDRNESRGKLGARKSQKKSGKRPGYSLCQRKRWPGFWLI